MKKNLFLILITTLVVSGAWLGYLISLKYQPIQPNGAISQPLKNDTLSSQMKEEQQQLQLQQQKEFFNQLVTENKLLKANNSEFLIMIDKLTQFNLNQDLFIHSCYRYVFPQHIARSAEIMYDLSYAFNPNYWERSKDNIHKKALSYDDQGQSILHKVNTHSVFANLLSRARRDSYFIEQYFTDKIIDQFASLFAYQFMEGSGGRNIMEALYYAHEDIKDKPELLNDIYTRALESNTLNDTNYFHIVSDRVEKLLLADHPITDNQYDDVVDPLQKFAFVYGFWARRHHEENIEVVFDILKRFKEKVDDFNDYE